MNKKSILLVLLIFMVLPVVVMADRLPQPGTNLDIEKAINGAIFFFVRSSTTLFFTTSFIIYTSVPLEQMISKNTADADCFIKNYVAT